MGKSIWPWILLLLGWIALASWICKKYLCDAKPIKEKVEKVIPAAAPAIKSNSWIYNDADNHKIEVSDYFKFDENKFNYKTPLSADFTKSMASTVSYLKANPERVLNVTGYYKASENNTSILPNLGLARANNISSYLTSLGVAPGQLITKGAIIKDSWFKGGILNKGADFAFTALDKANNRIASIRSRLVGKPLTLYFNTNANSLSLTAQQRTDFADMMYYLNNVSSSNLDVSGHTDGTGNRAYNVQLSQDRAAFVRDYLTKNGGIKTGRMKVSGLGPDKPIDTNNTDAGRAKNRRVEITLK